MHRHEVLALECIKEEEQALNLRYFFGIDAFELVTPIRHSGTEVLSVNSPDQLLELRLLPL